MCMSIQSFEDGMSHFPNQQAKPQTMDNYEHEIICSRTVWVIMYPLQISEQKIIMIKNSARSAKLHKRLF